MAEWRSNAPSYQPLPPDTSGSIDVPEPGEYFVVERTLNAPVDHRALLREAADALDEAHKQHRFANCDDFGPCPVDDLIRRLREAAK